MLGDNEDQGSLIDPAGENAALKAEIERLKKILDRDFAERKRMEEELRRLKDELELRVQKRTAEVRTVAEALRVERQRFHDVLNVLPVYVVLLAPDYRVPFANRVFLDRFGDAQGRTCFEHLFNRIDPCENCETYKVLTTMQPHEWEWNGPDNRIYSVFDFPFTDTNGSILILEMGIDITEQRRIEEERVRLEEQLHHAQKMQAIGTLAGGIAHDFNNMLAVIMGNAELALDEDSVESMRRNIKQILNASKHSRNLIKQILTFSRKDGGEGKVIEIVPVVREATALLRASLPTTIAMDLKIRAKADTTIVADPTRIEQVIVNLASNAAYAMRETGGTLTISLSTVTGRSSLFNEGIEPSRYVKLTVKDSGTGITPEVQQRMFEPFFTTKEPGGGTGMGLSVVYGIIKGYGGEIEVESEIGKGSKFVVLLPHADGFPRITQEKDEDMVLPATAREHILFIDDERALVDMATIMLERLGYRVTAVTNSNKALNVFSEAPHTFDLVITDQTMPEMTGLALASKFLGVRKDLPIILCTGFSETVSPEKAKEAGIREFIMKPVTKREMAQAVRRVLEWKRET